MGYCKHLQAFRTSKYYSRGLVVLLAAFVLTTAMKIVLWRGFYVELNGLEEQSLLDQLSVIPLSLFKTNIIVFLAGLVGLFVVAPFLVGKSNQQPIGSGDSDDLVS